MSSSLTITHDGTTAFRKMIAELGKTEVLVGVPSDEEQPHLAVGDLGPNQRIDGVEISNAELAAIHDTGAPEANIPARPFMIPGVEKVKDAVEAHLKTATIGILAEDQTLFELELNRAGNTAVDGIRTTIEAGIPPPLSPRTLADRRARGISGTTPLLATRQLYKAISFVVRRGK